MHAAYAVGDAKSLAANSEKNKSARKFLQQNFGDPVYRYLG